MAICVRLVRGLAVSTFILAGTVSGVGVVAVASSRPAAAQAVNSIVVQGNRRIEGATIRSYFKAGPNGRLDAAQINAAWKALYATGLFSDVEISHVGGHLVVRVAENPVINKIAFEGNRKAKDAQLRAEIQSKPQGPLSKPTVQADVQRIVDVYHHSGRYDVTVDPQIIELPNNRVNLVFKIHEGPKTVVKEIRFVGAHAYSWGRLRDVIKTTEANWFSFLQTTDIYDPDRVEADRDLLRRFYLKHGYADVRIVSATGVYDPAKKGFVVTFTIDEGPQYHVGTVDVISNVHAISPAILRTRIKISPGSVYNADLVEKSVEAMTIEAASHGYAFATVHPRGDRDVKKHLINLVFVVEEGRRAYIERIDIHGNTRTRDYVIRREFDIGEGDPYNRALINRAERRLKNLNFFKSVKITTEPGSAPDRVIVDVNVVEKSTGQFSVSGGYSTAAGFLAQVSVAEHNLMGRGQFVKASVSYGQYTRGFDFAFVQPYLFGYRMAGGINIFARQNLATNYVSYQSKSYGATLHVGFGLTQEMSLQPRYTILRQEVSLPRNLNDCQYSSNALINGGPGVTVANETVDNSTIPPSNLDTTVNYPYGCYANGEAALPVRIELANGPVWESMLGYTLAYNTLDNNKSPTSGIYAAIKQDFAGIGGDVNFIRTTAELRNYYEVFPDVVSILRLQGGEVNSWGGKNMRMLDEFFMGPNLVRGFQVAGIGPRDLTPSAGVQDALGGSLYWGASLEFQTPLYFLPKEIGIKLATFADAGSLWDYQGPTYWSVTGERLVVGDTAAIRSSVGIGIIWDSPLGPLRFDIAYPITKASYDRTQIFRFSGGTSF